MIPIDPDAEPVAHVSPYKRVDPSRPLKKKEEPVKVPDLEYCG